MAMTEYLERDKEKLLSDLAKAGTPERASSVLSAELDRILFQYNEQCSSDRGREAAAYMMQAVRNALPLVDSAGETRVWESTDGGGSEGEKGNLRTAAVLAAAGLVLGAAALALAAFSEGKFQFHGAPYTLVLVSAAVVLGFLAGRAGKAGPAHVRGKRQQTEIRIDGQKIYRTLHTVLLAADRELEQIGITAKREEAAQLPDLASKSVSDRELDLFAGLLEAEMSGDGRYALDKIADVRFYLHKNGIEAVEYSEENKAMFDIMPSRNTGTIRPALVSGGRLLKKGLAAGGR